VIGDGALGTWAALRDVYPEARRQACWVHAIARVLDALPKRLQPDAKKLLHEMMEAPSQADCRAVLERFREAFDAKYPKAVAKLDRDWQHLTAFYDFPAEHWRHLRTLRMKVSRAAGHRQCLVRALACVVGVVDPRAKRRIWGWCLPRSCCPV
jgi:putative transposase